MNDVTELTGADLDWALQLQRSLQVQKGRVFPPLLGSFFCHGSYQVIIGRNEKKPGIISYTRLVLLFYGMFFSISLVEV
jgi:hypothetical protein